MNTQKQLRLREQPLPPKYRRRIDCGFFKKLSFKQRLQILIGYNIELESAVFMEHSPGNNWQMVTDLYTTKRLHADGHEPVPKWKYFRNTWRRAMLLLAKAIEKCMGGDAEVYSESMTAEGVCFIGITRGNHEKKTLKLVLRLSGEPAMFDKDGNYEYPEI